MDRYRFDLEGLTVAIGNEIDAQCIQALYHLLFLFTSSHLVRQRLNSSYYIPSRGNVKFATSDVIFRII